MTGLVTLHHPSGLGGSDIVLNVQRVDYSITCDVRSTPVGRNNGDGLGTGEGYGDNAKAAYDAACIQRQPFGAPVQMTITGVFKSTGAKTATAFMNDLETAMRTWWTYIATDTVGTYPRVTWRRGAAEYMLPLRISVDEDASNNPDDLNTGYLEFLLTLAIDTRSGAGYTAYPVDAIPTNIALTPPTDLGGNVVSLAAETISYELSAGDLKSHDVGNIDESRLLQTTGAVPKITVKGVFGGTDAVTKMNGLITAALRWWTYTVASSTDFTKYPQVTWHSKTRYMLISRLSIVDLAETDGNELTYDLELLIDSRSVT